MAYQLPVTTVTRPADLAGQPNGELTAPILVEVRVPRWGIVHMHHLMARVWAAFAHDCQAATGVILTVTSRVDAYRSLTVQKSGFYSRYEMCSYTEYLVAYAAKRAKKWPAGHLGVTSTTYWRKRQINGKYPATSALPGTSNHGDGIAADVAEYRGPDTAPGPIAASKAWPWIVANARRYGLSWEG